MMGTPLYLMANRLSGSLTYEQLETVASNEDYSGSVSCT